MSNCTKCHNIGGQVRNAECLTCHTEITQLQKSKKGLHASADVTGKKCIQCHSEHHGRTFRIVNINTKSFDHSKTSFQLSGKHAKTDCYECHTPKYINDEKIKKHKGTFLGLSATCNSCHTDVHQASLGNNCENCHGMESFKPAIKFNHDKARFVLTGAHLKVDCSKCHLTIIKNEQKLQQFKGIDFANCSSCHQDFHKGKFGPKCNSCHVTESFRVIKNLDSFDHSKTNYKLLGKHASVECKQCHTSGLHVKPKYEKCIDCHTDYHKGDFVKNNFVTDCRICHDVKGFQLTSFTIEEHAKANFKLTGAHLAVPCQSCHFKNDKWKFKIEKKECSSCHSEVHGGSIPSGLLKNNDCLACHTTNQWKEVTYDHSATKFPLLGSHLNQSCTKCHVRNEFEKRVIISFKKKSECVECHNDVHQGQFIKNGIVKCESCHQFNNWKPEQFDHSKTSFPLDGAHSKVYCYKCHKQVADEKGKYIKYKFGEVKCALCHL
ncbi:MAG: multiheme c-type cytochrome [Melioribacteraceae bacterium]